MFMLIPIYILRSTVLLEYFNIIFHLISIDVLKKHGIIIRVSIYILRSMFLSLFCYNNNNLILSL
jgi:hypothetical protein